MPIVHGLEFRANQSEIVKDLVRELLKDGNCAVYALHNMKPQGELRLASTLPSPNPKKARGVFLRIRPGVTEAIIVRPMNAKAGQSLTKLTKISMAETLQTIRIWRKQTSPHGVTSERAESTGKRTSATALQESAPLA
jgi:hypothetical protein